MSDLIDCLPRLSVPRRALARHMSDCVIALILPCLLLFLSLLSPASPLRVGGSRLTHVALLFTLHVRQVARGVIRWFSYVRACVCVWLSILTVQIFT